MSQPLMEQFARNGAVWTKSVPVRTTFRWLTFCKEMVLKTSFDSQQNFLRQGQLCEASLSRRRRQMYFIVTFVNYVVTNSHKQTCEGNSSPRNRKISVLKLFAQETWHRDEISGCLTVKLKYSLNILYVFSCSFLYGSRHINGAVCLF
jgi:hypothetical protein